MLNKQINIELQDTQWQFEYVDHDRNIARAIVYDEDGLFYFVRAEQDDDFGKVTLRKHQAIKKQTVPCFLRFACTSLMFPKAET